jgi:hypothetical protein
MLADTDAGCLITAAQSGAQWGYAMVAPQLVLIPILFMAQEIVVGRGVVTGKGHGRLIREQFGVGWGLISAGTDRHRHRPGRAGLHPGHDPGPSQRARPAARAGHTAPGSQVVRVPAGGQRRRGDHAVDDLLPAERDRRQRPAADHAAG